MRNSDHTIARFIRRVDRRVLLRSPMAWLLQMHWVVLGTTCFHLLMIPLVRAYDGRGHWILPMSQVFNLLAASSLVALGVWARVAIRRSVHASSHRPEGLRLLLAALLGATLIGAIPGVTVARLQAQLERKHSVEELCEDMMVVRALCQRCYGETLQQCEDDPSAAQCAAVAGCYVDTSLSTSYTACRGVEPVVDDDLTTLLRRAQAATNSRARGHERRAPIGSCDALGQGGVPGNLRGFHFDSGAALEAITWRGLHYGERLATLLVIVCAAGFVALTRSVATRVLLRMLAILAAVWFLVALVDLTLVNIPQHMTVAFFLGMHACGLSLMIVGWVHRRLWVAGLHGGLVAVYMAPFVPFLWVWQLMLAEKPSWNAFAVPRGVLAAFAEIVMRGQQFPHGELLGWAMSVGLTIVTVAGFAPLAWRAGLLPANDR